MRFRLGIAAQVLAITAALSACIPPNVPPTNVYSTKRAVGASARDYLSDSQFKTLIVEIQAMPGAMPAERAVERLQDFLNARLNKAEVQVALKTIPSGGQASYSITDIQRIEDQNRAFFPDAQKGVMTAYYLFLDGEFSGNSGDSKVLGVAHRNTSLAMFEKSIQGHSGGLGKPARDVLETTVLNHEFAHILGLVNTGTPVVHDHQDVAHGAHCAQETCLMHWSVETGDFVGNLLGGEVPELDSDCLDDLRANGGK